MEGAGGGAEWVMCKSGEGKMKRGGGRGVYFNPNAMGDGHVFPCGWGGEDAGGCHV